MNVVQERIARKMCAEHGGPNKVCELSERLSGHAAAAVQEWLLDRGHPDLAAECGPIPIAAGVARGAVS